VSAEGDPIDPAHPTEPGPETEPIRLLPYDRSWPQMFELEQAALREAIGPWVIGAIHHIGSTAVPGLEAKPVIDILAGVASLEESRACFDSLARLDYLYSPYLSEQMHWFCKPNPRHRTHHLHLIPVTGERYLDELRFRDRLRDDPRVAGEYVALKRGLAQRFRQDRGAYTEAKGEFISAVLAGGPAGS
jgi:GrpB-like predicted nucleotidyltransferase (UPF0157 family)